MKLSDCNLCSLYKNRIQVVKPLIKGTTPIVMFVGEAPGKTENKKGKPMCGKAGKMNDKIIDMMHLDSYIITNCIQCIPIRKNGKNGKPKLKQMKKCKIWLEELYKVYKPRLIILYGEYALNNLLGLNGIGDFAGRFYENRFVDTDVIFFVMYHPAALLYNKHKYWPIFKRHAVLVRKFFGFGEKL